MHYAQSSLVLWWEWTQGQVVNLVHLFKITKKYGCVWLNERHLLGALWYVIILAKFEPPVA